MEGFEDLIPVPCPQNLALPFRVCYSERYDAQMSVLRALLDKMELSERAQVLTSIICARNISNQTAWWYREKILESIGYDYKVERDSVDALLFKDPKPYQLWNHVFWLVKRQESAPDETDFFRMVISLDARNFHAWQYFLWYAEHFGRWDWLLGLINERIGIDPLNGSAWNARFQVVSKSKVSLPDEIDWCMNFLAAVPEGETICNYVRGLVQIASQEEVARMIAPKVDDLVKQDDSNVHWCALAAHVALKQGNDEKYQVFLDKLCEIDTKRARFWARLKSGTI